jgi:glycosyltransferase involved in cell wall biosynthesis
MVERGANPQGVEVCYANVAVAPERTRKRSDLDLDLEADVPIIVYACRICEVKQPRVFAKTLAALRDRNHPFIALVIGDGPDMPSLKAIVERERLGPHVRILGSQPNEITRELMAAADVAFLPSRSEGIAISLYEALAEGVPVVAADVGGQRELVTPDVGILVERDDDENVEVERYAEALSNLLTDRMRRRQMGQAGREKILSSFTLDRLGPRMDELLSRAIELANTSPRAIPDAEDARDAALEAIRTLL